MDVCGHVWVLFVVGSDVGVTEWVVCVAVYAGVMVFGGVAMIVGDNVAVEW